MTPTLDSNAGLERFDTSHTEPPIDPTPDQPFQITDPSATYTAIASPAPRASAAPETTALLRINVNADDAHIERHLPRVETILTKASLGFFSVNGFRGLRPFMLVDPHSIVREAPYAHAIRAKLLTSDGAGIAPRWIPFLILLLSRSAARFDAELVARCACAAAAQEVLIESFSATSTHRTS